MSAPRGARWLLTLPALWQVWLPLLAIAGMHYGAPHQLHWVHDVARRLFYVPIILGAWHAGVQGGLAVAALTIGIYLPHALPDVFGQSHHGDPGQGSEKLLEMGFYLLIGGFSGSLFDRQAALAAQVREQQQRLSRAARLESLGQLTAGLAHEIRNPLHAMRGSAEILLDAVPEHAPEARMGKSLLQEIDRLSTLLGRFLRFAGKTPPQVAPVQTGAVLERVQELLRAQASRQGTELMLTTDEAGTVLADEEQLVQVALAIGLNALQALEQGGFLALQAQPWGMVLWNNGPPIPETELERIFDPFSTTREGGTGLGLSEAWRIVNAHQGELSAENVIGGVRFVVRLPE